MFDDGELHAVFIDGRHDLDALTADIRAWAPKVKPGGWLAGHDHVPEWPGVIQACVAEFGTGYHVRRSSWVRNR